MPNMTRHAQHAGTQARVTHPNSGRSLSYYPQKTTVGLSNFASNLDCYQILMLFFHSCLDLRGRFRLLCRAQCAFCGDVLGTSLYVQSVSLHYQMQRGATQCQTYMSLDRKVHRVAPLKKTPTAATISKTLTSESKTGTFKTHARARTHTHTHTYTHNDLKGSKYFCRPAGARW